MAWNNDGHGMVIKAAEVKLFKPSHSWGMKLSQLPRQAGRVRIMTYSLPDRSYIIEQFNRRPNNIAILCHAKFRERAIELKALFPDIDVAVSESVHAKLLLIEPGTIYVTSANFGESHWSEVGVGIRSEAGHKWYAEMFDDLWKKSEVI